MSAAAIERLRRCRVCGCTPETESERDWVEETLCSACTESLKHVVSMTREYPPDQALSVATCSCGRFQEKLPVGEYRAMDLLIRNHWREIVALAGGTHV